MRVTTRAATLCPMPRSLRLLVLAAAICLAAACSGSSDSAESSTESEDAATATTEIELFPIPSPEASPTEAPLDDDAETAEDGDDDDTSDQSDDADDEAEGTADSTDDPDDDSSTDEQPAIWRHVDGFELVFENGRPNLNAAVDSFYAVGDGDISESVDNILDSIDHPRSWQDAADAAVATFPEGLGEASGVFALLSTQWATIGCEAHWAGMNQGRWNTHLFDHLVGEAAGLPPEQADNQAGILLEATNAAIATLCPRLLPA